MTAGAVKGELEQQLDRNYRHQRHVYDLTRRYYLLGREACLRGLDPPPGGSVLEMGCGTARNLVLAAQMYPDAHLFGIDLSGAMLESARATLLRRNLAARVTLAHADATSLDPVAQLGIARFDRIFFSYSLSMIPPWERALAHALSLLTASGSLHVVDFGTGARFPRIARTALRRWLAKFHVTPRDEIEPVLVQLAAHTDRTAVVEEIYGTYAVRAVVGPSPWRR